MTRGAVSTAALMGLVLGGLALHQCLWALALVRNVIHDPSWRLATSASGGVVGGCAIVMAICHWSPR